MAHKPNGKHPHPPEHSPNGATNGVANGHTNGHANGQAGLAIPASMASDVVAATWSVSETLSGKRLLITGTTGFLGKVVLSMLLRYHPDVAQIYLMIRARRDQSAEDRFYDTVVNTGAFDPLREIYGAGLADFLREKVTVVAGDVCKPHLGMGEAVAREISSELDVFINSAGLTNFNPNLRNALEINTLSMDHVLNFLRLGGCHASLLHVSTTYVAGITDAPSPEIFPGPTIYPAYDRLKVEYDARREVADCLKLIEHTEELSQDQEHHSRFANEARLLLEKHNLDPNDEADFHDAYERARTKWVDRRLADEGRERAAHWGWANIYTYTKSLGERILAEASDEINLTITRPAVIESAVSYPQVGWNEGINTTAPICFLIYKGHRLIPTQEGVNMDVIPVDYVSGGMIATTAALIRRTQHDVYHFGSSDLNPVSMVRLCELCNMASRRLVNKEVKTPTWKKLVLNSIESVPVSQKTFDRRSAPGLKNAAKGLRGMLNRLPTRSLGGVGQAVEVVKKNLGVVETITGTTEKIFELFKPFIHDNKFTFIARNLGELTADLPPSEQARYGSVIKDLDWRDYWVNIHVPGLYRHAFPALEAKLKESNKTIYTYDDLVELFDASTHNFAHRIAMQHHADGIVERYTYAELKDRAERAALHLRGRGLRPNSPVLLVGDNRPQWGMAYFGILKAGGVAVPVDSESTARQIYNVATSCRAQVIIVGKSVEERLGLELQTLFSERDLPVTIVTLAQLFTLALESHPVDDVTIVEHDASEQCGGMSTALVATAESGNPLASLIYTSGTTGNPKGVMLTHKNFTHLLSSLQQTFRVSERDGFLSVLPLHHTFEFACGFLMPLSKGASITYMEELSSDALTSAMKSTRITSLIGVPALWQLLYRRIDQGINDAPPPARWFARNMLELNTTLRDRMGINIGPLVFGAVHQAFGGRIKHLISGGAALPANVLKAFYGMGFDLYEGYGLTEAAPVLTVNRPDKGFLPGSVGKALPGITIDIKDPNDQGVGEVIAKGPNVMLGYLDREEDTGRALQDGWLYTGDLGKLDKRGNLTIVGREKELIVTAGGKNVYPDELEDTYGKCPGVLELSIVGLPDGNGSERVACLVRPDHDDDATPDDIAKLRSDIREWIRVEGSRVPSHHRIQALRFWGEEFPRTATRKVKRKEVVAILERLLAGEAAVADAAAAAGEIEDTTWGWLDTVLGTLADFDPARIHNATHFLDDLGFDSLMTVELTSILEARGYHIVPELLATIYTVGELQNMLAGNADASTALIKAPSSALARVDEVAIHPAVAKITKNALYVAQMKAYDTLFNVKIYGRSNIPHHNPNLIVVANHCSHLDMGLVKFALGQFGTDIRALAAADYFFSNTARKTYFKNFTNLVPVERSGTLESSLAAATESLARGEMLLMFPEGTRSRDGKLQSFRRGLGYLADSQTVDILPLYIDGTHRALPKGQRLPSPMSRGLKVYIGQPLSAFEFKKETKGMSPTERYEHISSRAHKAVEALRDAADGRASGGPVEGLAPIFESLNGKFEPNQIDSSVSYYFSLGNVDTHKWTVTVNSDKCAIYLGKPTEGQADCVIKTTPEIFRKMIEESYVPSMDEFMSGAIKTNNPDLLARFQSVFRL